MIIPYGNRPPFIHALDRDVDQDIRKLVSALDQMCVQMDEVYSAISLYEYCGSQLPFYSRHKDVVSYKRNIGWTFIAAREGAMRMADARQEIDAVNGRLRAAFKDEVEKVNPSPNDLFESLFPKISRIRHSAAHLSAKHKNDVKTKAHSVSGSFVLPGLTAINVEDMTIGESITGDVYAATWDGELVSYEISSTTLDGLEKIKNLVFQKIPKSRLARPTS